MQTGWNTRRTHAPRWHRGALIAWIPLLSLSLLDAPKTADAKKGEPKELALTNYTIKANDITASIRVTKFDEKQLEKIGEDFKNTYSVRNLNLSFKNPDKIRLEGRSPTRGTALMILNGATRSIDVPRFHIRSSENLDKSPGKRQSLLEFGGVLSADTLRFMQGSFVKEEDLAGKPSLAYDLRYSGAVTGSHYRVWIDPKTRITLKREWYDNDNQLRATFLYSDPHEYGPDVWLPGRVEVRNAEGVVGAIIVMDGVKINQGLSDSLFTLNP